MEIPKKIKYQGAEYVLAGKAVDKFRVAKIADEALHKLNDLFKQLGEDTDLAHEMTDLFYEHLESKLPKK